MDLKRIKSMQESLMASQEKISKSEIEGVSGGGLVKITRTVGGKFISAEIDQSIMDDKEMLEDLIIAALNDSAKKSEDAMNDAMSGKMPPGLMDMMKGMKGG